MTENLQHYFS